mmetsp:Transcript_29214/g.53342  ORF Transcript_29214/g.53342 Transcript_29214/m.53342 type:complete len:190 (+) Transcript_29214:45-614(+)
MLFPVINVAGPPTQFALKARPYFIFLLVLQGLLVVGRFLVLDLWGSMMTLLVVGMGCFIVSSSHGIDPQNCMYYGLICMVNGIFDLILCLERWMHLKFNFFSRDAPAVFNIASAIFILSPIVELSATVLSGLVYLDAQEAESRLILAQFNRAAEYNGVGPAGGADEVSGRIRPRADVGFEPYCGRGHHL